LYDERDINKLKEKISALTESESRYRTLFETTTEGILIADIKGRKFKYANPAICRMLGYTETEILALAVDDIHPNEALRKVLPDFKAHAEEDKTYQINCPCRRKNGSILYANISSTKTEIDGEKCRIGFFTDMTEYKNTVDALRDSEAKYHNLVEYNPEAIAIHCEGKIVYANQAIFKLLGTTNPKDVIGKPLLDFFHPDSRDSVNKRIGTVQEGITQIGPTDEKILHPDGSAVEVEVSSIPATFDGKAAVKLLILDISKRIRAEEDLRRVSENAHAILWRAKVIKLADESQDAGGYFWNTHYLNLEAAKKFLPLSHRPGNSSSQDFYFSILQEDRIIMDQRSSYSLNHEEKSYEQEYRLRDANGSIHWLSEDAQITPIDRIHFDILGFIIDVTARKKAELALRFSEARLSNAMKIAKLGYWEYNVAEDLFHFDDHFYELFHTTAEKVGGDKMSPERYARTFLHPDDAPIIAKEMEKALTTTDPNFSRRLEHRILYADGGIGYISVQYFIEKDEQGKTIRTFGANQDITESKQAEEDLRRLTEDVHAILWRAIVKKLEDPSMTSCGGFSWTTHYLNLDAMNKFLPLAAHPSNDLVQMLRHSIPDEDRKAMDQRSSDALRHGDDNYEQEFRLRDANDVLHWMHEYARIKPVDETQFEVIGFIIDISEQKQLQTQLLQAQKMEAIGNLAGGVAHDFNNLLTVIQGHAQLLMMDTPENDPRYFEFKEIVNATTKAANLTRQLLLFSRKQAMEFKPINLNETILNLLKLLKRLIGEDITVNTILENSLWNIEADEGNLEQVVMNLAINARDAMPTGGTLTIKTENLILSDKECSTVPNSRTGRFIRLSIEDSGLGIDAEIIGKIFEPFFTTKETGKGTGLGLSVVYGIIKKHEGWINVYSEVNEGTVFKMYFPVSNKPIQDEDLHIVPNQSFRGNGEHILIVEDEEDVLEFISAVLFQNGYTAIKASNAAEAIRLFQKDKGQTIQLIISDVVLPDKNGIQLAEDILTIKADIQVILCSGYTEEKVQQSIIKNKNFRFLQKPYRVPILLSLIQETIRKIDKIQ